MATEQRYATHVNREPPEKHREGQDDHDEEQAREAEKLDAKTTYERAIAVLGQETDKPAEGTK